MSDRNGPEANNRAAVVVTGASTGIGRATALHLDGRGFRVFAGVRREADGEELKKAATQRLSTLLIDVTDGDGVRAAAERIAQESPDGLVGLVNNAGIAVGGPLEFVPIDAVRYQFEVNVIGMVAVTQALLPSLRKGHGRIVNIGSVGGRTAAPFVGPYAASKHAVEAFTESLRQELRPWGIWVAVIEPGAIATPIWEKGKQGADQLVEILPPAAHELYAKPIPAMREMTDKLNASALPPEVVAKTVEHALTASKPRARYLIGREAKMQVALRTLLPTRTMDRLVARFMGI